MSESGREVRGVPQVEFDHHSATYADGWPDITREMRAQCPITHSASWGGFYVVTAYEQLRNIILDDATFSSAKSVPGLDPENQIGITIPPAPMEHVPIDLDPPDNRPYRKLLEPLFSPKQSRAWEPFLREVVAECLDSIIESGRGDIVLDIANPVPALLTCKLMGLPLADWRFYAEPMHEGVYTPPNSAGAELVRQKTMVMFGKIAEAVAERRTRPQDDLITKLVQAEINGAPLTDKLIMDILALVLVGGVDTTTSLIANGLRWLGEHPDERQRLREHPELMPTAREEMLRYFAPTQGLARTVTCDTIVGGARLSLGDRVFMSFAAANRDPETFAEPDQLIIDRQVNPHLTFGVGVHRCLGSNIARVEFDVVVSEVLRRMPDYVVDEAKAKRYTTIGIVNGWEQMPFTFTPGNKEGAPARLVDGSIR